MYIMYVQRLERLLGVSGTAAKKKRAKLDREIEVEDGMGDEFGAFLSGLDRISKVCMILVMQPVSAQCPPPPRFTRNFIFLSHTACRGAQMIALSSPQDSRRCDRLSA